MQGKFDGLEFAMNRETSEVLEMEEQVLVTGGSRGLGLATVKLLLTNGYYVSSISRQISLELIELSECYPSRLETVALDIRNAESVALEVRRLAKIRPIYGLINNAAQGFDGLFVTQRPELIADCIQMNLTAPLMLTRQVLRYMLTRRRGRIVFVSSLAAHRGYTGLSVYSATKAGIEGFVRVLAREIGSRTITVNAVVPGFMDTEMTSTLHEEQIKQVLRRTPLGRLTPTDDVASMVAYLLSPAAAAITGSSFIIDAGASI